MATRGRRLSQAWKGCQEPKEKLPKRTQRVGGGWHVGLGSRGPGWRECVPEAPALVPAPAAAQAPARGRRPSVSGGAAL